LASKFESDIQLSRETRKVNGKSIMGVLMLAASHGTEITLHISGPDEEAALNALVELVNQGFGELLDSD
jgi:phosphocarrier protein